MEQIVDRDVVTSKIDQLLNDLDDSLSLTPRNLSLAKATESLTGISKLMCDKYYDFIDLICNTCADRELCEKFYLVFPMNVDKNAIINNEIVKLIQIIVINFSDRPNDFPEAVVSSGIFDSLVDVFLHVADSSENIDDPKTKEFLLRSVVIINNIARHHCQKIEYKRKKIKNALKKYMKSNCDEELRGNSLLTLSYLLDDSEVYQLDEGVRVIEKLIEHIRCINEPKERSRGFTLKELLHGLMNLWRNDKMKIKIEAEGGIPLLIKKIDTMKSKMDTRKNDIVDDEITKLIQTIVINLSDYSDDFAQSVVSSGIFDSLVDVFLQFDSRRNINDPKTKEFLLRSVVIIRNIARNHCRKIKHKIEKIKNTLKKYMESNCVDELGVNSILTLSYLLDDSEVDQLVEGVGVIKKLIEYIDDIIKTEERLGGFTLKELLHGLMRLSRNDKMKIKIKEEGGIPLLKKVLNTMIYKINVRRNDLVNNEITKLIQTIVINLSDYSNDFAQSVVSSRIFDSLVNVFLQVDSSGHIDNPKTKEFLFRSVVIIKNIARNHCQKIEYRIQEIEDTLKKYMKSNCDDELGVNSILTLSYLLDDSEVDQLEDGVRVIEKLIEYIRLIIETKERSGGFTLKELLHGLMRLSRNDKMKIKIEERGIQFLIKIIKTEKDDEVKSALGTIDNLCHNHIIKQKLKDDYSIEEVLKPLAEKGLPEIKEYCKSIFLKIQNKTRCSNNSSRYMMAVLL